MKNLILLILLGLITNFSSFAQQDKEISFSIEVAYDSVGLEEQLEVKYTLKNTKALGFFETPIFEGFQLLAGPMTSQSMSIVNGDMTQSTSYTFILKPIDLGIFMIPATSIDTKEGLFMTEEIALVIVKEINHPRINNPSNAFQDPFSNNPFFNDPFFNQEMNPRDMMKDFDQMFKMEPPSNFEDGLKDPNKAPSKKKSKKKEKLYKL
jgi:hypothetical protein